MELLADSQESLWMRRTTHKTFSFHLVKKLEFLVILFTATPMINKPIDLHGLLALIWKPAWARSNDDAIPVDDYRYADAQIQNTITAENVDRKVGEFAWVLDPTSYYTRAGGSWPEPDAC